MPKATFETPDGDDIEIDPAEVIEIGSGEEDETTLIELENGDEVTVVATQLEVAAALGLDPLEYINPEDDDPSIEGLVEDAE